MFPCRRKSDKKTELEDLGPEQHKDMDKFEEVPEALLRSPSMKIRNLRKVFDSKVAVDNTSMTMYEG
jgi:hypothetical protein